MSFCCQDSKMIKTNKLLRLKTKNGRLLDVVREHYLRKDVPCHSEICTACEQGREVMKAYIMIIFLKVKAVWVKIFKSYVVCWSFRILLLFKKMHHIFVAFNQNTSFGHQA